MLERILWSKVDAVEIESNVPVGIEHKTIKYNGTIDTNHAFDGIGTLCMTSLPILAVDKDQEKKDWIEEKCFFQNSNNFGDSK
jgi:hypothetical protein